MKINITKGGPATNSDNYFHVKINDGNSICITGEKHTKRLVRDLLMQQERSGYCKVEININ